MKFIQVRKLKLYINKKKNYNWNERHVQVLVDRAENEIEIIMPGYTHMQRAQPIKWSQWLLRYK